MDELESLPPADDDNDESDTDDLLELEWDPGASGLPQFSHFLGVDVGAGHVRLLLGDCCGVPSCFFCCDMIYMSANKNKTRKYAQQQDEHRVG